MEEPLERTQSVRVQSAPADVGPNAPSYDTWMRINAYQSRRLEWAAVVLFVVSLVTMMYLYSLYYRDEAWGLLVVAVNTAACILFLASVTFSVLGSQRLSKIALVIGIGGLMICVASLGVKLMKEISDYSDRWM